AHAARRPVVCQISEQPVGTGVSYIGVKPLRGVAIQCPSIQSTIPSTGSTALRKLALSRSRWTIPKPSAQCSKMPMITSGSPKEPENEQQVAGQSLDRKRELRRAGPSQSKSVLAVAARTRIASAAGIRLNHRKSLRPFKGIFCHDISEFESYMPSHAVGSLWRVYPVHGLFAVRLVCARC